MDAASNPVAQHFDEIVTQASQTQKASAIKLINNAINQSEQANSDDDEQAMLNQIKASERQSKLVHPHHKEINVPEDFVNDEEVDLLGTIPTASTAVDQPLPQAQAVTPPKNPVIVNLARDADDLKVASLAHLANRKSQDNNEVTINLR